ncbi:hypothetical protein CFD26_103780 [Aspergillus turcosus]|uniref:Uncharacterized protein n=1 Tax=Aspergillus turcosus TaxID=1245748 RepID=A0A3R7JD91_9EURO|nr:hypothetical protein CFD26_103780 [Aspergillus turcosus]
MCLCQGILDMRHEPLRFDSSSDRLLPSELDFDTPEETPAWKPCPIPLMKAGMTKGRVLSSNAFQEVCFRPRFAPKKNGIWCKMKLRPSVSVSASSTSASVTEVTKARSTRSTIALPSRKSSFKNVDFWSFADMLGLSLVNITYSAALRVEVPTLARYEKALVLDATPGSQESEMSDESGEVNHSSFVRTLQGKLGRTSTRRPLGYKPVGQESDITNEFIHESVLDRNLAKWPCTALKGRRIFHDGQSFYHVALLGASDRDFGVNTGIRNQWLEKIKEQLQKAGYASRLRDLPAIDEEEEVREDSEQPVGNAKVDADKSPAANTLFAAHPLASKNTPLAAPKKGIKPLKSAPSSSRKGKEAVRAVTTTSSAVHKHRAKSDSLDATPSKKARHSFHGVELSWPVDKKRWSDIAYLETVLKDLNKFRGLVTNRLSELKPIAVDSDSDFWGKEPLPAGGAKLDNDAEVNNLVLIRVHMKSKSKSSIKEAEPIHQGPVGHNDPTAINQATRSKDPIKDHQMEMKDKMANLTGESEVRRELALHVAKFGDHVHEALAVLPDEVTRRRWTRLWATMRDRIKTQANLETAQIAMANLRCSPADTASRPSTPASIDDLRFQLQVVADAEAIMTQEASATIERIWDLRPLWVQLGKTVWPKGKDNQETIGIRYDYDGEVTPDDGIYHKFQIQPNAGKIPSTFKTWRDKNGGTHKVMATAFVKTDFTKDDVKLLQHLQSLVPPAVNSP